MISFKIGVMADSFRLQIHDGIRKAAELGADGVQVYAAEGDVCAENMDNRARQRFKAFCAEQGLEISALCGDLGGHGFNRQEDNPGKVARSKAIVNLAVDLGTPVVTTHIGIVPSDPASEGYAVLLAACKDLGEYAAPRGISFAIETGPEPAKILGAFLDDVGSKGIGVNMDPANFVMVTGDDPVKAVYTLQDYIVHTHAKDGVKYKECDAVQVYTAFAEGGLDGMNIGELFDEVPLGQGAVDFDAYHAALSDIGYDGYLTIEREVGGNPEADIRAAVEFLRGKVG